MFTINFCRWLGESNAFPKINVSETDKSLVLLTTIKGTLKEGSSILTPYILVDASDPAIKQGILSFGNYAYISEFKRWYFIDDIVLTTKNLWRISMRVDALNTYSDTILKQIALISRSESVVNSTEGGGIFSVDSRLPIGNIYDSKSVVKVSDFPLSPLDSRYCWFAFTIFSTKSFWYPQHEGGSVLPVNPYGILSGTFIVKINTTVDASNSLFKILFGNLVANVERASFYCSIYSLPFDPTKFIETDSSGGLSSRDSIDIGTDTIDLTPFKGNGEYVYTINPKSVFRFTLDSVINDFLDLPPYSKYFINLPLKGIIEIPTEAVRYYDDSWHISIQVDLLIDYTIGMMTYKCHYTQSTVEPLEYNNEITFLTTSVAVMNPVPISTSNSEYISRVKDAYTASFIADTIGTALSTVVDACGSLGASAASALEGDTIGAYKGNAAAASTAAHGFGEIVSGAFNYNNKVQQLSVRGSSNNSASIFNSFNVKSGTVDLNNTIALLKYSRKYIDIDLSKYRSLNGYVCLKTLTLSECTGYTEVGDVHLNDVCVISPTDPNDISPATIEELSSIESLLKSGVIILKKEGSV